MSKQFAKLFDSPRFGQILAKRDTTPDDTNEVRVWFAPPDMGVCSAALEFHNTDSGNAQADKLFVDMTLEFAEKIVANALPPRMVALLWPEAVA